MGNLGRNWNLTSPKNSKRGFFTDRIVHRVSLVYSDFFFFLNINAQTPFFKKGFPWTGYTDDIFFQKHGHTFCKNKWFWQNLATALRSWHHCHFNCCRKGNFTVNQPTAGKHLCLGQGCQASRAAAWSTLVAMTFGVFWAVAAAWCPGRTWGSRDLWRIQSYWRQLCCVLMHNTAALKL